MFSIEETKAIKQEFWVKFGQMSAQKRIAYGLSKKWMLHKTGISQVSLKFELTRKVALVAIDINSKDVKERLLLFEKFESLKSIINSEFEGGMEWDFTHLTDENRELSRISYHLNRVSILNKNDWPVIFNFLFDNMLKVEYIIHDYSDYLQSNINE
ncbi:MAG: DUF4268 domain-containing protein [Bacteroidales bacterium]|nr:DUF4268 domain-containing protein [Bacteroidales bacterium]